MQTQYELPNIMPQPTPPNLQRPAIRVRELGRYAQQYVDYALQFEELEQQQVVVEKIVDQLVAIISPANKKAEDVRIKIWAQLLEVSQYKIKARPAFALPAPKGERQRQPIHYPTRQKQMRFYGKILPKLIEKNLSLDAEKRPAFTSLILAYMKVAYLLWNNREVSNQTIADDFRRLCDNQLEIPANANYDQHLNNIDDFEALLEEHHAGENGKKNKKRRAVRLHRK